MTTSKKTTKNKQKVTKLTLTIGETSFK